MAIGFTDLTSTNRKPDKGYTRQTTPKVLTAQFGDGYSQRLIDGINPLAETIDVTLQVIDAWLSYDGGPVDQCGMA